MKDGIPTANHNTSRESKISLPPIYHFVNKKINFIFKVGWGDNIITPIVHKQKKRPDK